MVVSRSDHKACSPTEPNYKRASKAISRKYPSHHRNLQKLYRNCTPNLCFELNTTTREYSGQSYFNSNSHPVQDPRGIQSRSRSPMPQRPPPQTRTKGHLQLINYWLGRVWCSTRFSRWWWWTKSIASRTSPSTRARYAQAPSPDSEKGHPCSSKI